MTERILDWRPRHDPRSRDYPIRPMLSAAATRRDRLWAHGPVTDQGREGACVGHAWTAEATAKPVPVDLTRLKADAPETPDGFAHFLYGMAQRLDPWPGEAYSGTSVLAGAQAAQKMGLLREYRWAFGGVPDVADTVAARGPVVLGIPWYEAMYEAPGGVLRRGGALVGGHAILAIGVTKSSTRISGQSTVTLVNSWGPDWGVEGVAEISVDDLAGLLREDGEACVPVRRSYGR